MVLGDVPLPEPVMPMLATPGELPDGPGWAWEFKWDGVRAIAAAAGDRVRLSSRNGNDVTGGYPELAVLAGLVGGRPVLLDGEIVALGAGGRSDFGLLQQRMHVRSPGAELLDQVPVCYYVFDLLHLDDRRLLAESYQRRRELLDVLDLEGASARIRVPPSYPDVSGQQILQVARSHGLEGVVAKRVGSRYYPARRSADWVKTALLTTQEVLVGGWTPGEGRRSQTLGALLLGAYDDAGRLRYLGHVGTGFTDRVLQDLLQRLRALEQPSSPFDETVPREHARHARWVTPQLVGEVQYRTLTRDGRLRHATWRGLRADKDPTQVTRQ